MMSPAKQQAISMAREWINKNPVYLDTETTGVGSGDVVVEIALVAQDGSILVDSLINTRREIPPQAVNIHGITREMTETAPGWKDFWPEIETALRGRPVGMYNAEFDLKLIRQTHQQNWMRWTVPPGTEFFDVMKIYAQFRGEWNHRTGDYRWISLEKAGREAGIPLPNSHRAKDDTLLTLALMNFIASQPV
jgi:DNA polymerase-3 subunit epsilon